MKVKVKVKVKKERAGRKRRLLGWTLLTLGVLVAGVWVASGWHWVEFGTDRRGVGVSYGRIFVWSVYDSRTGLNPQVLGVRETGNGGTMVYGGSLLGRPESRWDLTHDWSDSNIPAWRFWGGVGRSASRGEQVDDMGVYSLSTLVPPFDTMTGHSILFWPIPLLLWTPAALLLRSGIIARRRALTGKCKACGYDLAGLGAEAKCPECGRTKAGE